MDFNIVFYDGDVEWTEQYGAYYAFITISQTLSPVIDLKLTVDNVTYNSTLNGNGFLFTDSGGTPIGMLSPDYEGATTCSLVMAQLPVDNHVYIEGEEMVLPVFYQGNVNCNTQGTGETPTYYGSFTANSELNNSVMLLGTVDGVQVYGTFNNGFCNLTENLMISHDSGYNYTLVIYSNEPANIALDLKIFESNQESEPEAD